MMHVIQEDLEESIENVLTGYRKKNKILSDREKRIVVYHETGHAMIATLIDKKTPVTKITIKPWTSGTLGYTMQVDEEERLLLTKTEMKNSIAVIAGVRVAENLIFGEITNGAVNDIEQATKDCLGHDCEIWNVQYDRYGVNGTYG